MLKTETLLFTAEVTYKELRRAVKNKPLEMWEREIREFAFERDPDPQECGYCNKCDIDYTEGYGHNFYYISCVADVTWDCDEDGTYNELVEMDYDDCMTEERLKALQEELCLDDF